MRWFLGLISVLMACGGDEPAAETTEPTAHEHEPAPGVEAPVELANARVMFVGLEDGATVTGPLVDGKVSVHVEMGVEGAQIQAARHSRGGHRTPSHHRGW